MSIRKNPYLFRPHAKNYLCRYIAAVAKSPLAGGKRQKLDVDFSDGGSIIMEKQVFREQKSLWI